jgi:hypothetical protein
MRFHLMRQLFRTAVCLLVLLCLPMNSISAATEWRSKQDRFWDNSDSLFGAIVALAHARSLLGANSDSGISSELTDGTLGLLYMFDNDNSRKAVEALSRLSSYYLGEAPGEVFSCVVVRKGRRMLASLEAQLADTKGDDCQTQLGKSNSACLAAFGAAKHREAVQTLIRQIKADTPCTIER